MGCNAKTCRGGIQLAVMMYVRVPLSLRNVEDLLFERGIDVCHEAMWPSGRTSWHEPSLLHGIFASSGDELQLD